MKSVAMILSRTESGLMRWAAAAAMGLFAAVAVAATNETAAPGAASTQGIALAVRAHAVSVDNQGVNNVKITLAVPERGETAPAPWSAATDANGWCELRIPLADLERAIAGPNRSVAIDVDIQVSPEAPMAPIAMRSPFVRGWRPDANQTTPLITVLMAPATGRITGAVLSDSNEPIAGAAVRVTLGSTLGAFVRQAVTDAAGHYEIAHLAYGTYSVLDVQPPAGGPFVPMTPYRPGLGGVRNVLLAEGATRHEDFKLAKGGRIIGRVLTEGAKPLAAATVDCEMDAASDTGQTYYPKGPGYRAAAKTDANGIYILGGLNKETFSVTIHGPANSGLAAATLRGISLLDASDAVVQDVTLGLGGGLIVLARQADGKAAAGAVLDCHGAQGQVDANGIAIFTGLPTGKYRVTLGGPGADYTAPPLALAAVVGGMTMQQAVTLPTPKDAKEQPANVKPDKGAIVTGVVTDPNGEPLADCRVLLVQGGRGSASTYATTRTGPDGRYEIVTSQPGPCQIVVGPPAGKNLLPAETPAQAFKPNETTTVDVALKAGCAITGKVGRDGKAAPWATIALRSKSPSQGVTWVLNNGQLPSTRTKLDGAFRLDGLAPGKYEITFTPLDPQYSPITMEVTVAGAKELDVSLLRTGSFSGHIRDSSGKALSSAEAGVSLQVKDGGRSATVTIGADGVLSAEAVAPGKYSLTTYVYPKGTQGGLAKPEPVEVTIDEGKAAEVNVTVTRSTTTAPAEPQAQPASGKARLGQ